MLYDMAMKYAEGNFAIAALYLMAITVLPIGLSAYQKGSLQLNDQSNWFWIAIAWTGAVGLDVSGYAPWINQPLVEITSR